MDTPYLPMKAWAEDDQPREKLLQKGVASLSTNELLAILLRSGVGGESALDLARRILADSGNNLNALARLGVRDFMNRYNGVGIAKAASIVAAIELGNRRSLAEACIVRSVQSSRDAYGYIAPYLKDLNHEEFWCMFLNRANHIQGCERLSSGGMAGTVIDVRILFRKALDVKAHGMIIAHNHPSGTLEPSNYDVSVTHKISKAGNLLEINLLDHLIIGGTGFFSFADEGLLKKEQESW